MKTTLIVDGDNLLTIGFYGLKNHFYKGVHIGGIFHFMNTLRRMYETHNLDKVVVFWDGENGSETRRKIYDHYKLNRKDKWDSEEEEHNYHYQRGRIKQYLEEIYVRQAEFPFCETDDCVAYYTQNTPLEKKIIFSSDADLVQLVSENTKIYNPSHRKLYGPGDMFPYKKQEIVIENVALAKILCGDPADNIYGIKNLGIKRLLGLFPEIAENPISLDEIILTSNLLLENNNNSATVKNLLTGVTKFGVFGKEFFEINKKIIILSKPLLTEQAIEGINELITEDLDSTGRSYRNALKLMIEDGFFTLIPKSDDGFMKYLDPFLSLTRKEKNNKRIIKIRNYE